MIATLSNHDTPGDRCRNAFFGGLAVVVAVAWFGRVYTNSVDVPFWDEWTVASLFLLAHNGDLTLSMLWAQHNEHRFFFPQILMLALADFGTWSQRRECLVSMTIATANLWLVWRLLRQTFAARLAYPLLALDAFILFTPAQVENWLWGYQTAWFIVDLSVLAALVVLSRKEISLGVILTVASLTILASYSLAFGLALIPAVFAVLYLRRRDLVAAHFITWFLASSVIVAVYFYGWVGDAGPSEAFIPRVLQSTLHIFVVIGASAGAAWGVVGSAIFGALGAAIGVALLVWTVRAEDDARGILRSVWAGLLVYAFIACVLIGIGRADNDAGQALASRYLTCSVTFWIALISLAGMFVTDRPIVFGKTWPRITLGLLATGFLVGLAWTWSVYTDFYIAQRDEYAYFGTLIARYDTASDAELRRLFPTGSRVRLEAHALASIGQLPEGQNAKPPPPTAKDLSAIGSIDSMQENMPDGQVVTTGWVVDPYDIHRHDRILARIDHREAALGPTVYNITRNDLTDVFGIPELSHDGFSITMNLPHLSNGTHTLTIALREATGRIVSLPQSAQFVTREGRVSDVVIQKLDDD